jgi:hypothetical protein
MARPVWVTDWSLIDRMVRNKNRRGLFPQVLGG